MSNTHADQFGNEIKTGDIVIQSGWGGGGAILTNARLHGPVLALTSTRATVDFPGETGTRNVDGAYLRVVTPVDGRPLITADEHFTSIQGA